MTKTIEEAANKYADNAYYPAPDYGWYESDDEQMKEVLADTFKTGADYLMSLPLASRLTAEEKERVRKEYANTYPLDPDCKNWGTMDCPNSDKCFSLPSYPYFTPKTEKQ